MKSSAPNSISDLTSPGSIGLGLALVGSVAGMLCPFGLPLLAGGVGLICLGAIVAAPDAELEGAGISSWWRALALAALACLFGAALTVLLPTVGRAVVIIGSVVVAAVAVFALPLPPRPASRPD